MSEARAQAFASQAGPAAGSKPIKVLYALDSFPQLSESYINAEIRRMQSWGVHVEVWSRGDPKSEGDGSVVVHRGELVDTLRRVRPDIVHTHWTQTALKFKDAAKEVGLPMTARGHWHFVPKQLQRIERDPTIVRLFMFPHLARKYGPVGGKILPMHSCFHPEWIAPARPKNRRMVVRTAACKKTKDLDLFFRVAAKLPGHRFVMILCSLGPNEHYRELERLNEELGNPVELVRDIPNDAVGSYLAEAGIYMHTYSPDVSFGMPVSIAEAMAAGCAILSRDVEGARDYTGPAGRYYNDEAEAVALIRETETWSEDDWAKAEQTSRELAAREFDDRNVLAPLLDEWKALASGNAASQAAARGMPMMSRLRGWLSGLGRAA